MKTTRQVAAEYTGEVQTGSIVEPESRSTEKNITGKIEQPGEDYPKPTKMSQALMGNQTSKDKIKEEKKQVDRNRTEKCFKRGIIQ